MVAIQHLPPKTRAVLILRDVLDWPAKDTAALLETSVAAVNSALQRARAGLKEHLPERRAEWAPGADPTEAERELLDRYVEASERADAHAIAALMREDSTWSMPPEPGLWRGRDAIVASWVEGGMGTAEFGRFRCLLTSANLQPAVACYLKRPGESRVPRARARRAAHRGGRDRRHHELHQRRLPGVRPAPEALMRFERRSSPCRPAARSTTTRRTGATRWSSSCAARSSSAASGSAAASVLSLAGLPLRALHNRGAEPAELVAVRRRRAARAGRAGR